MLTSNENIAYAAGFFDGEGCVRIAGYTMKNGETGYMLRISVKQTNRAPLMFLQSLFGGFVTEERRRPEVKRCWVWHLAHTKGAMFLEKILPALQVKFVEAAIGIWFQETFRNAPGHGVPVDDSIKQLRRYFAAECMTEKRNNF